MKQSTDRILTTHVGSLARPHSLLDIMKEREFDRPYDAEALDREIADAVKDRVRQQVESRHRHRRRRRDEQGQLPRLREGSPRRLRGRHGRGRRWRRRGRPSSTCSPSTTPSTSRSTRRPSARCGGSSAKGPITLHRPQAVADRHRQPQGGVRGPRRLRHLHAGVRSEWVRSQRVLQDLRGVPRTRSPTRCARSTSASSTPGSSCRSTTRG